MIALNLKNLFTTLIPIGLLLFVSPVLLVFAFLTSLIWVPLLLLISSTCAIVYFISQKTPLGSRFSAFYAQDVKEKMDKRGGFQPFFLENLNNILCFVFPKLQRRITNYGYAVINQDGRLISDVKVEFEDERFPLQLYHYLATSFEKYKNLSKWTVLELECQRGGGVDYISRSLKAKKCIGVTSSVSKAKFCYRRYVDSNKLDFYECRMEDLLDQEPIKDQKFDLIINVEGRSRFGTHTFQNIVEAAENLLKPGGIFVCADYGEMAEMARMSSELENSKQLKMLKKENLTVNVLHGFKLEKKRKQSLGNLSIYGWIRLAIWKLRGHKRNRLETNLRDEKSIYMAFLMKKE